MMYISSHIQHTINIYWWSRTIKPPMWKRQYAKHRRVRLVLFPGHFCFLHLCLLSFSFATTHFGQIWSRSRSSRQMVFHAHSILFLTQPQYESFFQRTPVLFNGEWYLETKVWALDGLILMRFMVSFCSIFSPIT